MSIIIDGADQAAFGLTHFLSTTKDVRGRAMKVRFIGVLEHAAPRRLQLYTMTEEFPQVDNHIIEIIHRYVNYRAGLLGIPPVLFVQLDNCTRENKNGFLMSYLKCLVRWGLFEEVNVSFLPIGHTHEDIDQHFSCTSRRLRSNIAITLEDLHEQLRNAYSGHSVVTHIGHVANFSQLCVNSKCLNKMEPFSAYRFFKFNRSQSTKIGTCNVGGVNKSICTVKKNCTDDWEAIKSVSGIASFIRFTTVLLETPDTVLPGLFEEYEAEITEHIVSEESRGHSEQKLRKLFQLRDSMKNARNDRFHWDLASIVETISIIRTFSDEADSPCDDHHESPNHQSTKLSSSTEARCNDKPPTDKNMLRSCSDNAGTVPSDYEFEKNTFVAIKPFQEIEHQNNSF